MNSEDPLIGTPMNRSCKQKLEEYLTSDPSIRVLAVLGKDDFKPNYIVAFPIAVSIAGIYFTFQFLQGIVDSNTPPFLL